MSGSEAEERIRAKVEQALRRAWPEARIIHELMLQQGGCRIDIAAVTPDRLIVAEIKSERDVLTRLERQLKEARDVADGVFVIVAEKHLAKAREVAGYTGVWAEDAIELPHRYGYHERCILEATCNSPARLGMLWASELRTVASTSAKTSRLTSIRAGSDYLTGAEVRRRVCSALRARVFPRADAPILSDLFPVASSDSISPYRAAA